MREFKTADELRQHYRDLKARIRQRDRELMARHPPEPDPKPAFVFVDQGVPELPKLRQVSAPAPFGFQAPTRLMIEIVARRFNVDPAMLCGQSRMLRYVVPRQVVCYLAHVVGGSSLPQIGHALDRDHTTVLHNCRVIEELMAEDSLYAASISQLAEEIRQEALARGVILAAERP